MGFSGLRRLLGGSCGFGTRNPPDPPIAGCIWQTEHWSPLNRAPSPEELVRVARFGSSPVSEPKVTSLQVSQTASSWVVRSFPSMKSANSFWVSPGTGPPAPEGPPRTPGSLCAKQIEPKQSETIAYRHDSRKLSFIGFLQVQPMRRLMCVTGINAFRRRIRTCVQRLPVFAQRFWRYHQLIVV